MQGLYRQEAYIDNEADANKKMSYVNAAAGLLAIVIWILYLLKIFTIPDHFFLTVCIMFPAIAILMFTPLLFVRTNLIRKRGYKYFILFSLLAVIIALNIAVPKHSLLFWPFAVLIANHYYNPTIGRVIYGVSIVAMFGCMYLGMFFGEFDENLFGGGVVKPDGSIGTVETLEERLELLNKLAAEGNNRYVKVLVYYFFPRAMIITLFFMVSNLLNRRTYQLLGKEIEIKGEQEKAKAELGVARDIQMNTLPEEAVDDGPIEIDAGLTAAKEVGGDLYDYVQIDEDHVAFLIGDVSGKGVPAAMFMMKTITSFRDFATEKKTPSQMLQEINTSIMKGNKAAMFVTCFLAIIDKRNGKVVYSNAGHNPPVVGIGDSFHYLKPFHGVLLGMIEHPMLKDEEFTLKPGESITLYTDGVTEARNINGEFFGEERLINAFNSREQNSIKDIHKSIEEYVLGFVNGAPQSDDITVLTLKYHGDRHFNQKQFDGRRENVQKMLDFIADYYDKNKLPADFKNMLSIAADEILSNIVRHGYDSMGGPILIELGFDVDENELCLTIADKAKQFNQIEAINDSDEPRVGGYGLLLVKNIMDECHYEFVDGQNVLTFKKKFK